MSALSVLCFCSFDPAKGENGSRAGGPWGRPADEETSGQRSGAFGNHYWPALYFADADGQIRHHGFGEGEYEYSEIVIQLLLSAAGAVDVSRDLSRWIPGESRTG